MNSMSRESVIYLDNNASTPLAPPVLEAMMACARCQHANPSSSHQSGRQARQIIESAREELLVALGADLTSSTPDQLIFTSSATEANNLALRGMAQDGAVVLSPTEHPSIARLGQVLLNEGVDVRWLPVDQNGLIHLDQLQSWLASGGVGLVSVIWANHETGVLQPIHKIADLCALHNVPLHTDATQIATKKEIDLSGLRIASMTFSAHKFHGPRGIGGLFIRGGVSINPLMHGGFQQAGIRPGTESPILVEGLRTAWQWASERSKQQSEHSLVMMRERLERSLSKIIPEVVIHGSGTERAPQTTFFSVPGVDRQSLFMALDQFGVACSTGAACESGAAERSAILQAMGVEQGLIDGALRLSLGHLNTLEEVEDAVKRIFQCINNLQHHSYGQLRTAPARREGSKMVD